MTLPEHAIFEAEPAGGAALYSVVHLLPVNRQKPPKRRDPGGIERMYVHHSGVDNPHVEGFEAMYSSAIYSVNVREFPCFAYTFWFSRNADRDEDGRLVVYRGNLDETRSWHTGLLANGHGVALALEGNTTQQGLSPDQMEALEAMVPWCLERYPKMRMPNALSGHWEAWKFGGRRKRSCPGVGAREWIESYRAGWVDVARVA